MFLKIFLCLTFNLFILSQYGNCENCDSDEVYLHLFGQIENLKRSLEIVNTRLDILYDKSSTNTDKKEMSENPRKKVPSIFDIRFDSLPKHCLSNAQPSSCAAAMECTRTSGIYNITDYRYSNQTFSVYCDYYNYEGDWTYVLRRKDGTEQFNRTWNDYVKGFGSLASEYWLGLDHLYALTNFYGPQELIVHIESFDGIKKFARYDNFAVGSAAEKYKLKSLGQYSGTAGDSLSEHMGMQFSTYDNDNDKSSGTNCAKRENGGFWYNSCGHANPTGSYLRGSLADKDDHLYWKTFGQFYYSHKTMIFMIRRQSAEKFE